jgi:hypothetical protein
MLTSILLSLLISAPTPSDTIRVGDVTLRRPIIGTDTIDTYMMSDGDRRPVAVFVQTTTEADGGYLVVQENRGPSGALLTLDSIFLSDGSLATSWHGDVTPEGSRHVRFSGNGRVRGVAVDTLGQESRIDEEIPAGLFDYSLLTLVADRLPLSAGYSATLATYDITRGPIFITLGVLAEETISLGQESFDVWRMEIALGEQTVTRWVERSTGRELRWSVTFGAREMIGERRSGGRL